MIRKVLITIVLMAIVTLFIYPQKDSIISVFRMTDEPIVISKGNYGQSLIVEISFSHDGLEEWIQTLEKPYPLLMLDSNWISRSPKFIEQIKSKNIPTGLLGSVHDEKYSTQDFNKDLQIYEKHFNNKPLWFMTSNYEYSSNLQQIAFEEEINLLSPSFIYSEKNDYNKVNGAIITLKIHEVTKPDFKAYKNFIQNHKFVSIEENIFGYSIKTKKLPE